MSRQVVEAWNPQSESWIYHSDFEEYDEAMTMYTKIKSSRIARVSLKTDSEFKKIIAHVRKLHQEAAERASLI